MIGVDLIEIERIKKILKKSEDRFLKRIFTEKERNRFSKRLTNTVISEIAARFAAKEATSKVLGTGIKLMGSKNEMGVCWKEIEIFSESSGKPIISLSGSAKERAEELGYKQIHVSLTHTDEFAEAVALAEKW